MSCRICGLMTTDSKQLFLSRRGVHFFERSSVLCVRVSNDLGCEAPPQPSDEPNQPSLAASIIRRRQYDAMLPSLSLPNRSRMRLILDLSIGVPFLLMVWGIDELRMLPKRIASPSHRAVIGNRREECWKKHEASE